MFCTTNIYPTCINIVVQCFVQQYLYHTYKTIHKRQFFCLFNIMPVYFMKIFSFLITQRFSTWHVQRQTIDETLLMLKHKERSDLENTMEWQNEATVEIANKCEVNTANSVARNPDKQWRKGTTQSQMWIYISWSFNNNYEY